ETNRACHRLSPGPNPASPGRGVGTDRLPAALAPRTAVARSVPVARFPLGHQPWLRRSPGQEPLSLFSLRCRRQRPGPVGRPDPAAAARGGARLVPATASTRALAGPDEADQQSMTWKTEPVARGEPTDARTIRELRRPYRGATPPNGGTPGTSATEGAASNR